MSNIQYSPFYHNVQSGQGLGRFIKSVNEKVIKPVRKSHIISKTGRFVGDVANVFAPGVGSKIQEVADVTKQHGMGRKKSQKGKGKKKTSKK